MMKISIFSKVLSLSMILSFLSGCNLLGGNGITFDLTDAMGIIKMSPGQSQYLNYATKGPLMLNSDQPFKKVTNDGRIDEFVDGTLSIQSVWISPNGYIYLVLSPYAGASCVLMEVLMDGTYQCLDNGMQSIQQPIFRRSYYYNDKYYAVPPVQFDDLGRVYYAGYTSDGFALRRNDRAGGTTDLIHEYVELKGFIVAGNGNVYLDGVSTETDQSWFRELRPDGSLNELNWGGSQWMKKFPDGNIYVGRGSIERIDTEAGVMESYSSQYTGYARAFYETPEGDEYAVVDYDGNTLWQYYPDVWQIILGSVSYITVVDGLFGYLAIAGKDVNQNHRLIIYNLTSGEETDLLSSNEVEVYHLKIKADGLIWFDGLRFADNQYVIGVVDLLDGNTVTFLSSTDMLIEEIKFF